jgi:hypothetical protein
LRAYTTVIGFFMKAGEIQNYSRSMSLSDFSDVM